MIGNIFFQSWVDRLQKWESETHSRYKGKSRRREKNNSEGEYNRREVVGTIKEMLGNNGETY
jgi:hypothetical protein